MKILHVITGLQKSAGTSVFCMELCDVLKEQGYDVTIAVNNPSAPDIYASRSKVKLVSIRSILEDKTGAIYDLIHIHGLWSPVLHKCVKWARRSGQPLLWSPHGMLAPWAMRHKWWKKCLFWYLYQRHDLQKAAMFHATSKQEVEWIKSLGFKQPVCVAPLGTHMPKRMDEKVLLKGKPKIILFVGRIYPVKNLDTLIKAFSIIKTRNIVRGWKIVLAGPDQAGHMAELTQLANSLGLRVSNQSGSTFLSDELDLDDIDVLFTGAVYGKEKDMVYKSSDLFVLPSFTENFGGVVVDALSFGIPVLASKGTPWSELNGSSAKDSCGWWIDIGVDPLVDVLKEALILSDAERAQMGQNGRKLVESKYSWNSIAKDMKSAYELILDGGEKPEYVRTD